MIIYGGSTIAEILHKNTFYNNTIKNSMDNHQEINSKIINDYKLGWVIDENDFKNDTFKINWGYS